MGLLRKGNGASRIAQRVEIKGHCCENVNASKPPVMERAPGSKNEKGDLADRNVVLINVFNSKQVESVLRRK